MSARPITADRPVALGAQVDLFRQELQDGAPLTVAAAVAVTEKFNWDWDWAARKLLSVAAKKAYDEAEVAAWNAYTEATAPARNAYREAKAAAFATAYLSEENR